MNKLLSLLKIGMSAGVIALADNCIKEKIEQNVNAGETIEMMDYGIIIQKHHNKGLPMNIADKHQKAVAALSVAALTMEMFYAGNRILNKKNGLALLGHSLIIGGALSNTYDRVKRGYVVDYVSLKNGKAIYNMSDFCIIGGTVLAMIDELM